MISVAMATYNGEKYIEDQLFSIYSQTMKVDECIIVDDQSTDKTEELILKFMNDHPDFNIHYSRNETNLGYKSNFIKAMSQTNGEIVFLCDQDDLWLKDKVKDMVHILEKNNKILVLASSFEYMDKDGNELQVVPIKGMSNNNLYTREVESNSLVEVHLKEFFTHNYFQGCSLAIRKKLLQEVVVSYDNCLPHDWFINLTASKYEGMYFYNKSYFRYRLHPKNTIGVPTMDISKIEIRKMSNTYKVRSQYAVDGLSVLDSIKRADCNFYNIHIQEFEKYRLFFIKHLNNLKYKKVFSLIFQNFDPCYRNIKRRNARIMDLIFVLTHFYKKDL